MQRGMASKNSETEKRLLIHIGHDDAEAHGHAKNGFILCGERF
jgi:hypothetical protein